MGRLQQRAQQLKKAAKTCPSLNPFINVSNAKKRRYFEEDQQIGQYSDDSAIAITDQEQWTADSEEVIKLSSEDELLPPSHQHQPGASSLSAQPQAVASAPPLSSSVRETQASLSTLQPPTSVEILQSSLTDIGSVLADLSPEDIDADNKGEVCSDEAS